MTEPVDISRLVDRAAEVLSEAAWEETCVHTCKQIVERKRGLQVAASWIEKLLSMESLQLDTMGQAAGVANEGVKVQPLTLSDHLGRMEQDLPNADVQLRGCRGIFLLLPERDAIKWHRVQCTGGAKLEKLEVLQVYDSVGTEAVRAITSAMNTHRTSIKIQAGACKTLLVLTLSDGNRKRIVQEGGIKTVVAGMKANQHAAGVQEQGCRLLLPLAENNEIQAHVTAAAGIVKHRNVGE
eukprot:519670-Rhodomonas_salina.5